MEGCDMDLKETLIIEVALKHFSFFGYSKTSLDGIAREAKISKSTIYKYAKNKKDLFQKCAEIEFDNMHKRLLDSLAFIGNPDEKLLAFPINKRTIILKRIQELGSSLSIIEEIIQVYVSQVKPVMPKEVELVKEILAEGAKQKIFNNSQIENKAQVIIDIFYHFEKTWWQLDEQAANESIKRVFSLLFEGIGRQSI